MRLLVLACLLFVPVAFAAETPKLSEADIASLTERAENNDPAAQFELAEAYRTANGVARDRALARQWMEKAAAQEHVPALVALSYAHLNDYPPYKKDRALSLRYIERANATGTAEGALSFGVMISAGGWLNELLRPEHRPLAEERLEFAYAQGKTVAAAHLAKGHRAGWFGAPPNGEKARKWYEEWAKSGAYSAHEELARLYDEGKLLPRDYAKALHHYTLASARLAETQEAGEHNTKMFLSGMYFRMAELNELKQPPDPNAAAAYYLKTQETFGGVESGWAKMRHARLSLDHGGAEVVPYVLRFLADQANTQQDAVATCLLIDALQKGRPGFAPQPTIANQWLPALEVFVFESYAVTGHNEAWYDYDLPQCKADAGCRAELDKSITAACARPWLEKS